MARMTLDELVKQLRAAYGTALRSIVLYGSSAGGEAGAKKQDHNVLVIVDSLDASRLRAASAASRAWVDAGNHAPLTLTHEEWLGSADIFPMEYADILDRHRVLHGEPPFDGIRVDLRDLRLQVEQEAMSKLLRLRQGLLGAGNDQERELELLAESLSSILVVFRAFLRLHATQPPKDNVHLVEAVAQRAGFDAVPFARVVKHIRSDPALKPAEAGEVLAGYLRGIERLVAYLEHFQPVG
jgi:hypothetical protein